jgi:hypothetical protein
MKLTLDEMLSEVYALSLTDKRADLVRLAGRDRINNDVDVVAFYLAKLAIDGSKLAQVTLDQFIQLEQAAEYGADGDANYSAPATN